MTTTQQQQPPSPPQQPPFEARRRANLNKAPIGKRLGIAGIVVGAFVGMGYGVSKWIAPESEASSRQISQVEHLSDLVEDGTRLVLVGVDAEGVDGEASVVRASLSTYYEDARRDEVFQESFAKRFQFDTGEYTVFLLTLHYGSADESASNHDGDDDDNGDESDVSPSPPPLRVGDETVVLELDDADETRESVALGSLVPPRDAQAALIAAAYAGEAEVPWGKAARRYVVVPGTLSLEQVRTARLTLADGRTLELTPRQQRYPVPPGLGTTDESP